MSIEYIEYAGISFGFLIVGIAEMAGGLWI